MRIAQVSPLFESVPPPLYGGTERIVYYLTEALLRAGHDVTLYASGDSITSADLRAPCERALRLYSDGTDPTLQHQVMYEMVLQDAQEYDIIHFHTESMHLSTARRSPVPTVTTLHGRLDLPVYRDLFRHFADLPMVSISQYQQRPLPWLNWSGVVHHGLPDNQLRVQRHPGDYLAFLGRISPEKRVDRAIEIARRVGLPLKIAAKIDKADIQYAKNLGPIFEDPLVDFIGEIGEQEKAQFLGQARALLFPIDWPEPFGLVMIEALACGTPVIAFRNGSVSEVIRNGETGFIVETIDEAVDALQKLDRIDRRTCRMDFERRFTADRMAADYLQIYRRLIVNHESLNAITMNTARPAKVARSEDTSEACLESM